jgi:hypothetical protein
MCKIEFETDINIRKEDLKKIRGYLGNTFREKTLLHNHNENGVVYSYPLIQYKFIDGKFSMIGINDGVDTLMSIISKINVFELDYKSVKVIKKNIEVWEDEVKVGKSFKIYRFKTPYFALNQKNFKVYKKLDTFEDKKEFLDRIMVGNILSFLKGIGIWCEDKISVDLFLDNVKLLEFKNQKVVGIRGEFASNIYLPKYIGLGKSTALGNGVVARNGR